MDSQPTANTASRPPAPQSKPLSCTNCRTRKLKCSREYPCSHCQRSGAECVFPTRKRIRKPRKNKNSELLQRLSRLESIVGNVGLAALAGDDVAASVSGPPTSPSAAARPAVESVLRQAQATPGGTQDDWQKALQASKASRYLSGEFWSSLCVEVEGLRQALEQSTDSSDDEHQPSQEATPESATDNSTPSALSPGMLLGGSSRNSYEHIEHPTPNQIRFLASTFFTNVDMILKILHRPSIEPALLALANAPEPGRLQLTPEREVLFFSIYHAAVASLPASACLTYLGQRRDDLMRIYSSAVEHLLVRADYLNSNSLETLQALTLFVACVRSSHGSKAAWALLSLPIRLAQALNLHRECSNTHLSPFEAELRRRLWWQLIVLDIRASEDRGTKSVVGLNGWDTRLPLNINDADFGPDSPGPFVEREGPTDMTFYLCTTHCSNLFLHIEHAQGAQGLLGVNLFTTGEGGERSTDAPSVAPNQTVEETVRHAQALESRFVVGADPNHPPSYLASVMVRLVILKLWLGMQYPVHPRRRPQVPPARQGMGTGCGQEAGIFPHEATLRTALSIMELNEYLGKGPYGDRFSWWSDTYVQWHPLAVVLAELCTQTKGELVDRAWRTVEDVFPRWSEVVADTKSGALWRPIRKLYKKAKEARAAATAGATGAAVPTTNIPTTIVATPALDAATEGMSRITTIMFKNRKIDIGTINVGTNNLQNTTRQPEGSDESTIMVATTTEPDSAYGSEIRNTREPSVPPDLGTLSMSPYSFNESMFGWRDLNFDIPPMLDLGGGANTMDWSTWDDFVNETQAAAGGQSKSGSSETSYH
ncbi:fungal-specific transcription factor domain-containing protein [Hypoxylon sp. FL1857]|nr:fungal-specific transcription factor domain-containing protein [Hypoxylon sp. FL1857]